jgi:hypothetical protein
MDPPVQVSRTEDVAQVRGAPGLLHDPGVDGPMQERPMGDLEPERVRELLRGVSYTAVSRDIVGVGFVGDIVTKGQAVEIELKSNTRAEGKVADMERKIRRKDAGVDLSFGPASACLSEQSS